MTNRFSRWTRPIFSINASEVSNQYTESTFDQEGWKWQLDKLDPYKFNDDLKFIDGNIVGHGQFGKIFLAHGAEDSMMLAVKEYSKAWSSMEENEKISFVKEIRYSVRLQHINVVRCFGFVVVPNVRVVYEYCRYGSCLDVREEE